MRYLTPDSYILAEPTYDIRIRAVREEFYNMEEVLGDVYRTEEERTNAITEIEMEGVWIYFLEKRVTYVNIADDEDFKYEWDNIDSLGSVVGLDNQEIIDQLFEENGV